MAQLLIVNVNRFRGVRIVSRPERNGNYDNPGAYPRERPIRIATSQRCPQRPAHKCPADEPERRPYIEIRFGYLHFLVGFRVWLSDLEKIPGLRFLPFCRKTVLNPFRISTVSAAVSAIVPTAKKKKMEIKIFLRMMSL